VDSDADLETLRRLQRFRKRSHLNPADNSRVSELSQHVGDHGQEPAEYIAALTALHDVVLIGEGMPTEQSGQFLVELVPVLAAAGVWNLGAEWLLHDDQDALDEITTDLNFDEARATELVLRWGMRYGIVPSSRVEVLRAAWATNRQRDQLAPPFRVLGLDYDLDYDNVTDRADLTEPEAWPHLRTRGPSARFMASVIDEQLLKPRRRAVISCSTGHAFTHHRRPYHVDNDRFDVELVGDRVLGAGNHLFAQRADRVATVLLHQPLDGCPGDGPDHVYAADGLVDMVFARHDGPKFPVGFDVSGSSFATLGTSCAHDDSPLGHLADGWIFLAPLQQMRAPEQLSSQLEQFDLAQLRRRMLQGSSRRPDNSIQDLRTAVDTSAAVIEMSLRAVGA